MQRILLSIGSTHAGTAVGRTLLSVAFDLALDFDLDLDSARKGHGFQPCRKEEF